ncbi:MAG: Trp repressor protein [Firmicutes bacterium ADurb.Bin193]|nr:MAG: Trp repressor protein [Firmicutes bacterium ADurb.Bin193]
MKNKGDYEALYRAVLALETTEECEAFFSDLCTRLEIKAMAQRLEVAKMLSQKQVYNKIVEKTGASSATVSRVSRSLNHGENGYKLILQRLEKQGL